MPSCSNCQTPYEEGQRFCKACGTELSVELRQASCPSCGAQLSDQAFCHECGTRLNAASAPERQVPPTVFPVKQEGGFVTKIAKGSPMQILALVGGCLVLLILILAGISWLSGGRTGSTPVDTLSQGKAPGFAAKRAPAGGATPEVLGPPYFSKPTKIADLGKTALALAPAVPEPELSLKDDMEETLFKMRKGQEQKDINLYMSCFSPSFPDLQKKRQETLERWVVYDFPQLVFNIDEVQEAGPDSHMALVTWEVEARNRNTRKVQTLSQRFKVGFTKERGHLLIKSLEKEGKEENE
jgi:hypothetical protein